MIEQLFLTVETRWRKRIASGRKCICCGDATMLAEYRLCVRVVTKGKWQAVPKKLLCQSCYDVVSKELYK